MLESILYTLYFLPVALFWIGFTVAVRCFCYTISKRETSSFLLKNSAISYCLVQIYMLWSLCFAVFLRKSDVLVSAVVLLIVCSFFALISMVFLLVNIFKFSCKKAVFRNTAIAMMALTFILFVIAVILSGKNWLEVHSWLLLPISIIFPGWVSVALGVFFPIVQCFVTAVSIIINIKRFKE